MHKVILFRGGMYGDLILSMIDKNYTRSLYPLKNVKKRYLMKKFYNYNKKEKLEYYKSFQTKKIEYTVSHDTNFCLQSKIIQNVIQIYCSDEKIITHFAKRFWTKNEADEISHVIKDLNSTEENKVRDYANDMSAWQNYHKFPHTFDIKNIYKDTFINDVRNKFNIKDIEWTKTVYEHWLSTNE